MNNKLLLAAVAGTMTVAGAASAQTLPPVITVVPASSPNFFGSPSYAPWAVNALNALEAGLPVAGGSRLTDPTAYEAAAPIIAAGDNIATGFTSWRGDADVAGTPFFNERGNRVQFGVRIVSLTSSFSFDQVQESEDSTDTAGDNGTGIFDFAPFNFTGYFFGTAANGGDDLIGVSYGDDGIKGTIDDIRYEGGELVNGIQINEAYYVGVGAALAPDDNTVNDNSSNADQQAQIDMQAAVYGANQPFIYTGTYTLNGTSGSGSVTIVPEPASLGLIGVAGLGLLRRRRGHAAAN